jgi:hypothetical protein
MLASLHAIDEKNFPRTYKWLPQFGDWGRLDQEKMKWRSSVPIDDILRVGEPPVVCLQPADHRNSPVPIVTKPPL